ncbi:putative methyltransferase [Buchnera aphidicola (Cinara tujafilina)]|uniref:Ribosomal RNA small subunit methyltransferase D n=1 Tax=Buchnera aphidicola (Cinara tujafilina) TaxID=261317 RepID=F7WYW3_9GAMM|nr:16S rRNA (guanine(966)-N(2))-methyltransferase RsmD [Buchnera aphidicola]AEH39613.1 putative methyltransferase [Buchnera aphidicola (Cinara tujafilina)]
MQNKYKKRIRIISGIFRGRVLHSIKNFNIRPTGNRVKETLFNWLNPYIKNKNCLDCFAGSGNLSIESISRLAHSVTALEINKKLFYALLNTIKNFSINSVLTFNTDTITWLKKNGKPFDIIYLDPPFHDFKLLKNTIILLKKIIGYIKNLLFILNNVKNL